MIVFNKLVNHNCTGQTLQAGLCLCCSQMPNTSFHTRGPFKEDNNCVLTADKQLGGTKKKTFN